MSKSKKDPVRVRAGEKAYKTRLKHERNRDLAGAAASLIPGYGPVSHLGKAAKAQQKIDKSRRKK